VRPFLIRPHQPRVARHIGGEDRGETAFDGLLHGLRWTFHFTTSASWLNAVENFFSKMTRQRIRRGVFRSIADLQAAINAYLAEHNTSPKPFVWTQSADAILVSEGRVARQPGQHLGMFMGGVVVEIVDRERLASIADDHRRGRNPRQSSMGFVPENQVRTRLLRWREMDSNFRFRARGANAPAKFSTRA
jgi:hypothetical protein